MNTALQKATLGLLYLLAIVFSLKNLLEPDLWWQLRTGEWILETGSIPVADPFSFTYAGTPWQNIKWGFELLIALISRSMGVEMLMLVQVVCSIGIVYFLLSITRLLLSKTSFSLTYLIVGLSLCVLEYRMSGRPEAITHLFFLGFVFLLLRFRFTPSRFIWSVPLLMVLWANLHEAFGIGLVLLTVFTVSAWMEAAYTQTQTKQQAVTLTQILGLSIVAVCVNPHHVHLLLKPFEIAGQVYENKYTSEFVTYNQPMFWTKEAWITLGLLAFVTVVTLLQWLRTKGKNKWQRLNAVMPLPLVVMMLLLVYLASTSHRNIVFAAMLLTPVTIVNLRWLFQKIKFNEQIVWGSTCVLFVLLYISIVSNRYYTFWESKHRYGLEVPADATPVGAANFLEQHKLLSQPVFSDYLTSSYLLWRLQPTFKTFIDLRDLDVFPASHFDLFARILSDPSSFEKVDSQYRFGSVVLLRAPQMQTLHAYLYHHPVYRLRYVDAVCCVYVKDSSLTSVSTYTPLAVYPTAPIASSINHLFNPWFTEHDRSMLDETLNAGEYYYDAGNEELASAFAYQSVKQGKDEYRGLELLGQIAYHQFLEDTAATRHQWLDSASTYFNKAYKLNPEYVPLLIDLGVKTFNDQQYKSAVNYLKKACELAPDNLKAQRNMAEVYKTQAIANGDQKTLELSIFHFNRANQLNPHNPEIMMNLGFLYFRLGDCERAVEFLEQIVDYPNFTELQRTRAKECIAKCR